MKIKEASRPKLVKKTISARDVTGYPYWSPDSQHDSSGFSYSAQASHIRTS